MAHAIRNAVEGALNTAANSALLPLPSFAAPRAGSDTGFDAFAAAFKNDLAPRTALEHLLVDRLALAAWRLRGSTLDDADAARRGDDLPPLSRGDLRAEKSLETLLGLLQTVRTQFGSDWGRPAEVDSKSGYAAEADFDDETDVEDGPFSNEWPYLPDASAVCDDDNANDEDAVSDADPDDVPVRWQDRLVFDENVSETSPVVKGTWVTVRHVVSLIVDGWAWSDVLRTHPELTEDDIRTCLAYTVAQDDTGEY